MSKQLTLEELSVVAHNSGLPKLEQELVAVADAVSAFANKVAVHLGVACGEAEILPEGTFCGFSPVRPDQPLPEVMKPFDSEGDWEMTEVHRNGCAMIRDGEVRESYPAVLNRIRELEYQLANIDELEGFE